MKNRTERRETTVHLAKAGRQTSMHLELLLGGSGEAPRVERSDEAIAAAQGDEGSGVGFLMERVGEREDCLRALTRVRKNTAMPTKYLAGLGLPKLAPH
jgi:hypothetical protein